MKIPYNERLLRYTSADESILSARLDAVRVAINHPTEKGKAVEEYVRQFIRELLPSEYGVSTGFIAYHRNECQLETLVEDNDKCQKYEYTYDITKDTIEISSQLDVIIYDALRFGPIARLGTCEVFPAEAVYAYIEVKSYIDNKKQKNKKTDLENIFIQSRNIRNIKIRQYHVSVPLTYTKTMLVIYPMREVVQIRSFVFCLEGRGKMKSASDLCSQLQASNHNNLGHLTGIYVYGIGFICSHHTDDPEDSQIGTFHIVDDKNPLAAFKNSLYSSLYRFPRPEKNWTPAIDRYYKLSPVIFPNIILETEKQTGKKNIVIDVRSARKIKSGLFGSISICRESL